MNRKPSIRRASAALATAALMAATTLQSASAAGNRQPGQSLSAHERKALVDEIKQNHSRFKQPLTEAEARATLVQRADGAQSARVPLSLWNTLSEQSGATGQPQLRETDGTAPVATQEGPAHE